MKDALIFIVSAGIGIFLQFGLGITYPQAYWVLGILTGIILVMSDKK